MQAKCIPSHKTKSHTVTEIFAKVCDFSFTIPFLIVYFVTGDTSTLQNIT